MELCGQPYDSIYAWDLKIYMAIYDHLIHGVRTKYLRTKYRRMKYQRTKYHRVEIHRGKMQQVQYTSTVNILL